MDKDNLHHFFHHLANSPLFSNAGVQLNDLQISRDQLMAYEVNIVRHTQAINENVIDRLCGSPYRLVDNDS